MTEVGLRVQHLRIDITPNNFLNLFKLFILLFDCGGSSLLHAGFLYSQWVGGYSLVVVHRLLIAVASLVTEHGLQACKWVAAAWRLSSCGVWASLLCSMWNLPGPGFEPVSPALTGGFLSTALPGKSPKHSFLSSLPCSSLSCSPLSLSWGPVDVMVRCWEWGSII